MNEKTFFTYQVPKHFQSASLENCDRHHRGYIDFAKSWATNPSSVFITGGYGAGKTYFVFAMLREMFRKFPRIIWPRYYSSIDLDSLLLQAIKSNEGDQWQVKDLASQDLLFIDDIGRESKSDRLKRQYFAIINHRYVNNLPTILTSNFSLEELGDFLDGAICSRIQEWAMLEFNGKDLRKLNHEKKMGENVFKMAQDQPKMIDLSMARIN